MNSRIDPPVDYVVRVARKPARARYEIVAQTLRAAFVAVVCALLLWWSLHAVMSSVKRADAAVASYAGPVCQMNNNHEGFCDE